jgi:hypothetical protein
MVEIGYRVVTVYGDAASPKERAAGCSTGLSQGVDGVRAAISPDNEASARLAQKLGFAHAVELGTRCSANS